MAELLKQPFFIWSNKRLLHQGLWGSIHRSDISFPIKPQFLTSNFQHLNNSRLASLIFHASSLSDIEIFSLLTRFLWDPPACAPTLSASSPPHLHSLSQVVTTRPTTGMNIISTLRAGGSLLSLREEISHGETRLLIWMRYCETEQCVACMLFLGSQILFRIPFPVFSCLWY